MTVATFQDDQYPFLPDWQQKLAMPAHPLSIYFPRVEHVIERCPLIVDPDTPILEVIPLMGQVRSSCILNSWHSSPDSQPVLGEARADCVLVVQDSKLVGILTERDVVRLSAGGTNLEGVTIGEVMTSPVTTLCLSEFRNIFTALSRLRSAKIRHLPIVNEQGNLVGVVTNDSIRACLQPLNLLKIRTVAEVMTTSVITASVTTPVLTLAQLMAQHQISCVVICQSSEELKVEPLNVERYQKPKVRRLKIVPSKRDLNQSSNRSLGNGYSEQQFNPQEHLIPVGIVTERDIVQFRTLGLDLDTITAGDIMSTPLLYVSVQDSLLKVHQQMQQRYVRRLVVCGSQGELLGIVTQSNLLQAFDSVEMYGTIELLQQLVEARTADLIQTNQQLQQQITERKKAEEACYIAQVQYKSIFENAVEGIFQSTPDGRYLSVNPAFARIYGYDSPTELISTITDISHQLYVDPKRRAEFVKQLQDQDTISNFESQVFTRDGSVIWICEKARAVRDSAGNLLYYEGFVEEITARKQAEAEVFKALAQEKELNRLKSEFVSTITHDFRDPLNTIRLSTEWLQTYSDQLTEEKKRTHFQLIQSSINNMVNLLSEVLLLARADTGKLQSQPTPLDLKQFCCQLVEEFQISAGEKHQLVFTCKGNCSEAVLDASLLRHILSNLLSNAIKYSPDGGTVKFEVICQDETALFRIHDRGIGIPPKDQQRLFQPFNRAKNVGTIPGTGLGLTIAKRCVEAHGGQISVLSKVGVGTTFTVTLPMTSETLS